ncbi:MAG: hypothetical protein H6619_02915 [Deltaproteobacteria bacterium]|nr:hypothetical protein [Deltaproteobacteria bacterium]
MSYKQKNEGAKFSKKQQGFILIFFLIGFTVLFMYGMIVLKTEQMYTTRLELNNFVASTLNAVANGATNSSEMQRITCNQLKTRFDLGSIDCSTASFPLSEARFNDGRYKCDVNFTYTPRNIVPGNIQPEEACLKIDNCKSTFTFLQYLSSNPYIAGAEQCMEKKPPVVMIMADYSRSIVKAFNSDTTPPPFLHSDAGYPVLTSAEEDLLIDRSLPFMYDSYLPTQQISFPGAVGVAGPYTPYDLPFSRKEITMPGGNGVDSVGDTILSLSTINSAYLQSMPDVVPQTEGYGNVSTYAAPLPPDPVQYIPGINGGNKTKAWAEQQPNYTNYKYRHGVMTQNELAQRCFAPHKLWYQRMIQQFMYMLDDNEIPFGALAYSNWIMPIMPLVPYEIRSGGEWGTYSTTNGADIYSTLDVHTLGPNPVSLPGTLNGRDFVAEQFGNTDALPTDTTDDGLPANYQNYTALNRQSAFDRILQPMTICAREMNHEVRPGLHAFSALPDAFDYSRVLEPNTVCADNSKHQIPTLERGLLNFVFRSNKNWLTTSNEDDDLPEYANGIPNGGSIEVTANEIYPGDCFGDQMSILFGTVQTPDGKDSLLPQPDLNPPYNRLSPCFVNTWVTIGQRIPPYMSRDRNDAQVSNATGCNTQTGGIDNACYNRDEVVPSDVTNPFRVCSDLTAIDTTLNPSNLNAASALSALRAGGFTKSGYPIDLPRTSPSIPDLTPNARDLYLTSVESLNVYPKREPLVDDFTSGALVNAYNILNSSTGVSPNPNDVKRVAVLFTDGVSNLSMYDVLDGRHHSAWFPNEPVADVLPVRAGQAVQEPDGAPFIRAVKESLQVIHRMVDDGIEVVIVMIDYPTNAADENKRKVFIDGLREPIGRAAATNSSYAYAICKDCNYFGLDCSAQLDGEPAISSTTPETCHKKHTRAGIDLVRVSKLYNPGGADDENYSEFQQRIFHRVAIELNRIIHRFKPSK